MIASNFMTGCLMMWILTILEYGNLVAGSITFFGAIDLIQRVETSSEAQSVGFLHSLFLVDDGLLFVASADF